MVSNSQIAKQEDALHQAGMTLLQRIDDMAKEAISAEELLTLAEARAWVIQPAQSHGG